MSTIVQLDWGGYYVGNEEGNCWPHWGLMLKIRYLSKEILSWYPLEKRRIYPLKQFYDSHSKSFGLSYNSIYRLLLNWIATKKTCLYALRNL